MFCAAHAQPASAREFRSGFGVVTKFGQGEPLSHIEFLPELGVKWVRDWVLWDEMEPSPGDFKPFPDRYARRLQRYKQLGIGVVYVLAYGNFKAYPKTPQAPLSGIDPKALGRYGAYVATQLQKAGVRFVIEVWNEPHNFQILKMVGGKWNGAGNSPWIDHYAEMLQEVFTQVRAVAPDAVVLDSEDVWVNHYRIFATGKVPTGFSGVGLHPYTDASSPGPEVVAPYENSDWARPFRMVDRDRSFSSAIARLRAHVRHYVKVEPQIWLTEWGWRIGERTPQGKVDESMVAAFLPRAFVLAEAAGAQALCWFSLYDAVDGPIGLIDNKGRKRPAFEAFATMNTQIGEYHLVRRLTPDANQTKGIQAYLFAKQSDQIIVTWNAGQNVVWQPLNPTWAPASAVGLLGEKVPFDEAADKRRLLPVGPAPVYLHIGAAQDVTWPGSEER
jgi:hypothetical protein